MNPFLVAVEQTIRKHHLIDRNDRVLIGVSGGADSVCLALVLKALGAEIAVAHLNHGLRGLASDQDQEFTRTLASRIGVPFFQKKISLLSVSGNVEAAGRTARKEFFNAVATDQGFTKIAIAHTRNDRAETLLLNLARGTGMNGLTAMPPATCRTIRPLIERDRKEIESYLRSQDETWRTDATNLDTALARNRMRHALIGKLESDFNSKITEALMRTIEILDKEDEWMCALTDDWLRENGTHAGEQFEIDGANLAAAPIGMARRIIRASLKQAGSSLQEVTFDQVEAARQLLQPGKSGKLIQVSGDLVVTREFDRLIFRKAIAAAADYEYELEIPGEIHIPHLRQSFKAELVAPLKRLRNQHQVFVDAETIGQYVRIRNWKPGDYYSPVGWPAGKLKKLFQRARVPRSQRSRWPVVVHDSAVVWVASFPVSREFAPCGHSQKLVAFEAVPPMVARDLLSV